MRKVILFMVLSIDGYVCGPNGELDWESQDDAVSEEMVPEFRSTSDTMLIGRNLFEGFEQYWPMAAKDPKTPSALADFAHWVEDTPKIVFSSKLDKVGWKNAELAKVNNDDDVIAKINELKQQPGGDMVTFGGAQFAQTLVRLDLVDDYRFKLQAIALGKGRALFQDLPDRRPLKLNKAKSFDSGVVALYYQK